MESQLQVTKLILKKKKKKKLEDSHFPDSKLTAEFQQSKQ